MPPTGRRPLGYVEYAPDSCAWPTKRDPDLTLEIDLDLYEMLSRILDGFTPSREEQRGRLAQSADLQGASRDDRRGHAPADARRQQYFSISKD